MKTKSMLLLTIVFTAIFGTAHAEYNVHRIFGEFMRDAYYCRTPEDMVLETGGKLLFEGADPNKGLPGYEKPLCHAAQAGWLRMIELLARHSARLDDVSAKGAALHYAARSGQVGCIGALAACGATLDVRDRRNRTPLHIAVAYGHVAAVERLKALGASLQVLDSDGQTPRDYIHVAPRWKEEPVRLYANRAQLAAVLDGAH